jgi:uncharacterized membrane protein
MNNISKTNIIAIVSVICLGISSITGHAIDAKIQNDIVAITYTFIFAAISIIGIIKDLKKNK